MMTMRPDGGAMALLESSTSTDHRRSRSTPSQPVSAGVSVVDTTEIRWFVTGALPGDVRRWFVGPTAVIDERCDRYLLHERTDIGVKFRNGEKLELKSRLETGPALELTSGLGGVLERWRKWTLADGLVEHTPSRRWIHVDKWIAKRRFSVDGADVEFSPVHDGTPACDVEIAAIRAGGTTAWSFAFAAHGPVSSRPAAIRAAWQSLAAGASTIRETGLVRSESMGYPEWLGGRCP
ncbi:MAG TPA: hypothetical protein VK860_03235 [Ilumatobacteraceae bacterium]|nr:hypothetical protein [Ilumatobacteraceae bacterium]